MAVSLVFVTAAVLALATAVVLALVTAVVLALVTAVVLDLVTAVVLAADSSNQSRTRVPLVFRPPSGNLPWPSG